MNNIENIEVSIPRAIGAILGAAIGDALGWPQERLDLRLGKGSRKKRQPSISFQSWERRTGGRFRGFRELISAGQYSDDTQLILASARSLLRGKNWSRHLVNCEFPLWLLYQRGGGRTIKLAARSWEQGSSPWKNEQVRSKYFASGANGAAMRVLPHALLSKISFDEMQHQVMANSVLTHGHPRALIGAMLYAQAAWFMARHQETLNFGGLVDYLLEQSNGWTQMHPWEAGFDNWITLADKHYGRKYNDLWGEVVVEATNQLKLAAEELNKGVLASPSDFLQKIGAFDKKVNGAGTVAAVAAVFMASLYSTSPISGLLEIAFAYGADTDTIASMTGGLLGALLGAEWLNQDWNDIQDKEYINKLAERLCIIDTKEAPYIEAPLFWSSKDAQNLLKVLASTKEQVEVDLAVFGTTLAKRGEFGQQLGKKWRPICWILKTEVGQTLYVTQVTESHSYTYAPQQDKGLPSSLGKTNTQTEKALFYELYNFKPAGLSIGKYLSFLSIIATQLEEEVNTAGRENFIAKIHEKDYLLGLVENFSETICLPEGSLLSIANKLSELIDSV